MNKRALSRSAAVWRFMLAAALLAVAAPVVALAGSSKSIEILAASYSPKTFTVAAGTTIVFKNTSQFPHTATADNGSFDTGMIAQGASKSVVVKKSGTIAFHCQFHGAAGGVGQSGTITVTAAANPRASHAPPNTAALPELLSGGPGLAFVAFAIAGLVSVLGALVVDALRRPAAQQHRP